MLKIKNNLQSSSIFRNLQPTTYPPATTAVGHVGRGHLKPSRGFTLIELLVVIAIIGILSSVVLASLNSARSKGSNAAVKANLQGIRAQAEIFYDNNNQSYGASGAVCNTDGSGGTALTMFADPTIVNMMKQMRSNNGGNNIACNVNDGTSPPAAGQEWAISTKLRDGTLWCIDNSGSAKVGATAANGKCP